MIDLKPYGAFLEHTIRPLIEEFKWLLIEMEKKGLKVDQESLSHLLQQAAKQHLLSTLINLTRDVTVTFIISIAAYKILK